MRESSLLKAVAKRKVVYNISRRGGLELVYAQMALAEYYIQNSMLDSAARCLEDSREINIVGDTSYLLGIVQAKRKKN